MSSLQQFIDGLISISNEVPGLTPDSSSEGVDTTRIKTKKQDATATAKKPTATAKKPTVTAKKPSGPGPAPAPGPGPGPGPALTSEREENEPPLEIPTREWYLNDRKQFIEATNKIFNDVAYKPEKGADTCGQKTNQINLMAHQRFVRDYLQLYTPYRGVLVYHGLGSGKTCTSIAIAEGIKTTLPVIVMTPASLQVNYKEELKKCGYWYRTNHHWKRLQNSDDKPEIFKNIKLDKYWTIDDQEKPNYNTLKREDQKSIDAQINALLQNKYTFINYNGNFKKEQATLAESNGANPYDNRVVIIDEVHQIISTIVKQIQTPRSKADENTSKLDLYKYLMSAVNCKIVLLTGTPIVNTPEETAVIYNMIRGYIVTHNYPLGSLPDKFGENSDQWTTQFRTLLTEAALPDGSSGNIIDYIEVSENKVLSVTRNPLHFVNGPTKNMVKYAENNTLDLNTFVRAVLKNAGITLVNEPTVVNYKALPDKKKDFYNVFVDETDGGSKLKKASLFKQRIIGLTSYFKSQKQLMPTLNPMTIVTAEMSDKQFEKYSIVRLKEIEKEEKKAKGKNIAAKDKSKATSTESASSGSYRPGSRQLCNFVFPSFTIGGDSSDVETDVVDEPPAQVLEELDEPEEQHVQEDEGDKKANEIKLRKLKEQAHEFLTSATLDEYSPKFKKILTNITDNPTKMHLVYSNWIVSGTAVLQMVLEVNGYVRLVIKKDIDIEATRGNLTLDEVRKKKTFIVHTGDIDSAEERNAALDIFNGNWAKYPNACTLFGIDPTLFTDSKKETELQAFRQTKLAQGAFANVIFISKTGSDGISLRNVRTVHLTEPYWQLVRLEQVIGRAQRICAHEDLKKEDRNVDVYLYISTITAVQLRGKEAISNDYTTKTPVDATETDYFTPMKLSKDAVRSKSSDEALYTTARHKYAINRKFLNAMEQSAIDCARNSGQLCYTSRNINTSEEFLYTPETPSEKNYAQRVADQERIAQVERQVEAKIRSLKLNGTRTQFYEIANNYYNYYAPLNKNYADYLVTDQVIVDKLKKKYMPK